MVDPSAHYRKIDVKRARRFGLLERRGLSGYLFTLPFIVGFFIILMPAVVQSFVFTLNNVTIRHGGVDLEWVGLANYHHAFFVDAAFVPMLVNLGVSILLDVIVVICFSFFISNVLNQKFIGRGAARLVFFLPVLLTTGIVASMGERVMALEAGTIVTETGFDQLGWGAFVGTHELMIRLGIPAEPIAGLDIGGFLMGAVYGISNIVNASGVQILIFLSALQSISPSLFEAAKVEGATKWEEFWKITFPMLTPMILVAVVYSLIDTFTNPRYGVMTYILNESRLGDGIGTGPGAGYGATLAWIYFALILVFLGLTWFIIARRVSYLD